MVAETITDNDGDRDKRSSAAIGEAGELDIARYRLAALDECMEGLFTFLLRLYDEDIGGFHESLPEVNDPHRGPRLEATGRAIAMLQQGNALSRLPVNARDKIVGYLQSLQDPNNGFFDDPLERAPIQKRRGRAIGYAIRSLDIFGAKPLYPLPGECGHTTGTVEYLLQRSAFLQWAEQVKRKPPGSVGSALNAQIPILNTLAEPQRSKALDIVFEWLAAEQDPVTGLWWQDNRGLYGKISNTFKACTLYARFERPIPLAAEIYRQMLHCMRAMEASQAIFVRNPLSLFLQIEPQLSCVTDAERAEIILLSIENILRFRTPDGGFASILSEQYGTTDGCAQATISRDALRKIAGP